MMKIIQDKYHIIIYILYHKARTLSNSGSFAGAWLHSVPRKNESQMDNLTFRHALKIRLGVAFEDRRPGLCKCKTRSPIDPHVENLFNCHLFTAGVKDRHDTMVHVFGSLCMSTRRKTFRNSKAW